MSKILESRLAALEGTGRPKSVYEATDHELMVAMGLTGDETQEEIDARIAEILGRRVAGGDHGERP